MKVRFWGTRGSIAKPGPRTMRYGGNTSCIEVRSRAGTLVVVDCGTGAHDLGKMLMETEALPLHGHMLISHTHWDHIQGWPFFAPLFVPGNEWDIYAPRSVGQSVREMLAGQMQYTYFPVLLDQLGAAIRYHELVEGVLTVGDINIRTRYLNHPALTLGYRFEVDGATLVYACDHEPYSRQLALGAGVPNAQEQGHVDFLSDADLVIHDAQYSAAEYETKIGWGHSTAEYAVEIGRIANVKAIALTHHDPMRDDDGIDALIERIRATVKEKENAPEVFAAAEGLVLELGRDKPSTPIPAGDQFSALTETVPQLSEHLVLLGVADTAQAKFLAGIVNAEGIEVKRQVDEASIMQAARLERPTLIVLEHNPPTIDGLRICRHLRDSGDHHLEQVPIAIVAAQEDTAAGAAAGLTTWLVTPFSSIYARTRLRAGLFRDAIGVFGARTGSADESKSR